MQIDHRSGRDPDFRDRQLQLRLSEVVSPAPKQRHLPQQGSAIRVERFIGAVVFRHNVENIVNAFSRTCEGRND